MPTDERHGLVEALIRAARERGDFDNLPGHGKPLELDDLSGLSVEQRFDVLFLRSMGELPLEALLAREIRQCRQELERAQSGDEKVRMQEVLRAKLDELIATLKARRSSPKAARRT